MRYQTYYMNRKLWVQNYYKLVTKIDLFNKSNLDNTLNTSCTKKCSFFLLYCQEIVALRLAEKRLHSFSKTHATARNMAITTTNFRKHDPTIPQSPKGEKAENAS